MNYINKSISFILLFALSVLTLSAQSTAAARPVLNNEDLIKMVSAGFSKDLVLTAIKENRPQFNFDAQSLLGLKKAGVSEEIIQAMVARQRETGGAVPVEKPDVVYPAVPKEQSVAASSVRNASTAESDGYGFQLGTVLGAGKFGGLYTTGDQGIRPAFGVGLEVGLHKYMGLFADFGYSRILNERLYGVTVKANIIQAGAGFEVVGSNGSRAVPYGKFGAAYVRGAASALGFSDHIGAPAILGGGGVKVYINQHFGVDCQVLYFRTVGNNGGGNLFTPTIGVFVQSK